MNEKDVGLDGWILDVETTLFKLFVVGQKEGVRWKEGAFCVEIFVSLISLSVEDRMSLSNMEFGGLLKSLDVGLMLLEHLRRLFFFLVKNSMDGERSLF